MGIPSYFSYVIKNHANILQKSIDMTRNHITFQRLYMDCNSILYDCYRDLTIKTIHSSSDSSFEDALLKETIQKIEFYIEKVRPSDTIFIAFDGVAPYAKMEQQRTRRYKSMYETTIFATSLKTSDNSDNPSSTESSFTTSTFTPGTAFMDKLSVRMKEHFGSSGATRKYNVRQIYIATPNEPGEGEHKLFDHLRKTPVHTNDNIAVYGLDADLIMLSLLHLSYAPQLYIFREAPAFANVLLRENANQIPEKDETEPWFLDIAKMGRSLASEMDCTAPDNHRMVDYVFLCFFLGNDFLPHFPALNIRTTGIQRLMDTYRKVIGNTPERFLVNRSCKIVWKEVSRLIEEIARHEHTYILQEYSHRKRWNGKTMETYPRTTKEEIMKLFQDAPILFREEETYICPEQDFWQDRYYQRLVSHEKQNMDIHEKKQVCLNYLEGLEWVFLYYTQGCPHWRWKYNYAYPPLLTDLVPYIPVLPTRCLPYPNPTTDVPFQPYTQLAYVMPPNYHARFLPKAFTAKIYDITPLEQFFLPHTSEHAITRWTFQWAFCRYFWESHIDTPSIPLDKLKAWDIIAQKYSK